MRKTVTLFSLFVSGICFSQNTRVITLDKALTNAAPSCFVKPAQLPASADSITLKFFDASKAITSCIRPCGLARRYYESTDTTGKPLSAKCYTTYPPLYILNGFALTDNNPSGNEGVRIYINDIERVDILKPAEAEALYGIIGKGGAVFITTKCMQAGNAL